MSPRTDYGPNHAEVEALLRQYARLPEAEIMRLGRNWRDLHGVDHLKARQNSFRGRRSLKKLTASPRSLCWQRVLASAADSGRSDASDRLRDNVIMLMRLGAIAKKFDEGKSNLFTDAGNALQDAAMAVLLRDIISVEDFEFLSRPWTITAGGFHLYADDYPPSS